MTVTPTSSRTLAAPADCDAFQAFAGEHGWGDGLPVIPPTPERVSSYLERWGKDGGEVIVRLPPSNADVTAEKLAVNAVMAGAPSAALPLLAAALEAVADPRYELHALNATTGSVTTALIVNGAQRHTLQIPYGAGCLGGAGGAAPAIGRAFQMVMRNVAGQRVGVTSHSTFGQPGRVSGIVFGEWEERSPWPPLAERRGVSGDAVTAFGTMGTMNICETITADVETLLHFIGRSLAYPGANGFLLQLSFAEVAVVLNPVWAPMIARTYPDPTDVQAKLFEYASIPLSEWPEQYRLLYQEHDRVDAQGRVRLTRRPEDIIVLFAGGLGGLHAAALHSWGTTITQTRPVQ